MHTISQFNVVCGRYKTMQLYLDLVPWLIQTMNIPQFVGQLLSM